MNPKIKKPEKMEDTENIKWDPKKEKIMHIISKKDKNIVEYKNIPKTCLDKKYRKFTPLTYAIDLGFVEGVKFLLDMGANPNLPNGKGHRPLFVAYSIFNEENIEEMTEIINLLLDKKANPNFKSNAFLVLNMFCYHTNLEISKNVIEILIKRGANPNLVDDKYLYTPLISLVLNESTHYHASRNEVAKILINAGAKLNATDVWNNTALFYSIHGNSSIELIQILIAAGADPNIKNIRGATPLMRVYKLEDTKYAEIVMSALLEAGADPNTEKDNELTPLMSIIMKMGRFWDGFPKEAIKKLIKAGVNLEATNWVGETPLMQCCKNSTYAHMEKAIELLIASGANLNSKNNNDWAIISVVCFNAQKNYNSEKILKLLISAGADLNIRQTEKRITPLMISASVTELESTERIVQILIRAGADLSLTDYKGHTALRYSLCSSSTINTTRILLDAGSADMYNFIEEGSLMLHVVKNFYCKFALPRIELLLNANLDVDNCTMTLLHICSHYDRCQYCETAGCYCEKIAELLIMAGADPEYIEQVNYENALTTREYQIDLIDYIRDKAVADFINALYYKVVVRNIKRASIEFKLAYGKNGQKASTYLAALRTKTKTEVYSDIMENDSALSEFLGIKSEDDLHKLSDYLDSI